MKFRRRYDPGNATILEVAYARTGSMLKAARVVAFIDAWSIARAEVGHEPSIIEYCEWWGESRSTVYGHLADFREVFTVPTPGPVLDLAGKNTSRRYDLGDLAAGLTPA